MECKQCKIKFHYCSSCDYIQYCSIGYCSDKCWKQSKEYINYVETFDNFISSLDNLQLETIDKIFYNIDKYEYIYDEIIDKHIERRKELK